MTLRKSNPAGCCQDVNRHVVQGRDEASTEGGGGGSPVGDYEYKDEVGITGLQPESDVRLIFN